MRLNFGSAHDKLGEDWQNVDAMDWQGNTDIIHDMKSFPYPFADNSIDEIRNVECLEHIPFKYTLNVLKEFNRILKPQGKIHIQVPDAGKAMEYYANGQVCMCVKHKVLNEDDAKANPKCPLCKGNAKINPRRWMFTFTGAQKHPYDQHLAIFTRQDLFTLMCNAGFKCIELKNDKYGWKLKVNAIK